MQDSLSHIRQHLDIFLCPRCGGDLDIEEFGSLIHCVGCNADYTTEGGIPRLFVPNDSGGCFRDVTDKIKTFYEQTPFPNYEELENTGDLVRKAEKGVFARLLNAQVLFNTRVLEAGCGTGQVSNYLGLAQRFVFGTDMCVNSLRLAQGFKEKNGLTRVGFYQMNLFKPIFKPESFHFVICNGVLHHTGDPFGGFQSLARLVKPKGYILIGLYNTYGRLITDARRVLFNLFNDRFTFLDPYIREGIGKAKKTAWFKDQYKNPHESKHTISEALKWFRKTGFDFMYGIPNTKAFGGFSTQDSMFEPHSPGNWLDHAIVQAKLMLKGSREGGFFIMIGKKQIQK